MSRSCSPSSPAPCRCTAIRWCSTPSASRNSAISAEVSDSATQSARSPAAWSAPRAFGPRATSRTSARTVTRSSPEPGRLRGVEPATEADAGRHHDDVDRVGDDLAGRLEQPCLVHVRHHAQGRRDHDGRTPARESTAQLVGTTLGGDQDPAAREHGPEIAHGPPPDARSADLDVAVDDADRVDREPGSRLVEALAGGEVEDLLVHRRGDGVAIALPCTHAPDDAPGHHVGVAERVAVPDGVHESPVVEQEQRDRVRPDQCRDAALGDQLVERADAGPPGPRTAARPRLSSVTVIGVPPASARRSRWPAGRRGCRSHRPRPGRGSRAR